jgi:hypothetical protein
LLFYLGTKVAKMVQNILFTVLVILFSATACKIDRNEIVDRDKFTFRFRDDSYLFFKNVRQIYYDVQDLAAAKWIAYRFSDRYTKDDKPMLTPVIVVDWLKNEAYLLLETNVVLEEQRKLTIREKNANGKYYSYSLSERGRENMLEFATKIYEAILAENPLEIEVNDQPMPFLVDDADRENFRVVMSDYYRLCGIF